MVDKVSPYSDSVLVNGDFIRHGISLKDSTSGDWREIWNKQKLIISEDMRIIRSGFKNIFPVIGNNDVAIHD